MRTARLLPLVALALALLAAPAAAYVIILKDGTQVITRDLYRVENGKARFVLQNGTESFLELQEIDIPKTDLSAASRFLSWPSTSVSRFRNSASAASVFGVAVAAF